MQIKDVEVLLVRELEGFQREIAMFPDDASVWQTAPGVTNSAATLALHVAGNLQHFVGAVLGGTGYVRNREQEFGQRSGTRASIHAELDAAVRAVRDAIPRLSPQSMEDTFPIDLPGGMKCRTGIFLMHLCTHAAFHLGQAGYLRRVVTADSATSGPIPLPPLVG